MNSVRQRWGMFLGLVLVMGGVMPHYAHADVAWSVTSAEVKSWFGLAGSADGTRLYAGAREVQNDNGLVSGHSEVIHRSTDGGATWQALTSPALDWRDIAASSNGMRVIAAASNSNLILSTNGGTTWTEQSAAGQRDWRAVAMSNNGMRIVAVAFNGYIYTSVDGGVTWSERTAAGSRMWGSVAMSADGTKIAALTGEELFLSADGGATWIQSVTGRDRMGSVAMSNNGSILAVASFGTFTGVVLVSLDGGATWTAQAEGRNISEGGWVSVNMSANGAKIYAGEYYSKAVYVSTNKGVTWRKAEGLPTVAVDQRPYVSDSGDTAVVFSGLTPDWIELQESRNISVGTLTPFGPLVSNVQVISLPAKTTITWQTDIGGDSQVMYGESDAYGSLSELKPGMVKNHSIVLTGLACGTTYHFQVRSTSNQGVQGVSSDETFETVPCLAITGGPSVENVTRTGATLVWGTSVEADSKVDYGTTESYGQVKTKAAKTEEHSVALTGLMCGTTYHAKVSSTLASSTAESDDLVFTTTACAKPKPTNGI